MSRVAVIGAGAFGCTLALELDRYSEVTVFERSAEILSGASTSNHLRHHGGYHYPRSAKTALESIQSRESFERHFEECVVRGFPAYYGVSKRDTKTQADDFLKFCRELDLPLEEAWPPESYIDRSKVSVCIKTPEPVYDPEILKRVLKKRLSESKVQLRLGAEVILGKIQGNAKRLQFETAAGNVEEAEFDVVVNATYSNFNQVNSWFNLPRKKVLYELVELLEVRVPIIDKVGLTIVDGEFSSLLPRGTKETFTLGHVRQSVLKEIVSDHLDTDLFANQEHASNSIGILRKGVEDFPVLRGSELVRSIFVTRVVKADVDASDERPTEITDHGSQIYSVFSGKVTTCVDASKRLVDKIRQVI